VTSAAGQWLWDVTFDGQLVSMVQMADGSLVQKADGENYVISWAVKPGQRVPQIEIVKDVTVDPSTGNIYYQNMVGSQAVALLNNGWRIDQKKIIDEEDQFFVTEPARPDQPAPIPKQAINLVVDTESGDISYDTIDGGASMTLRSRKLQ
jgi:hypothetical protein